MLSTTVCPSCLCAVHNFFIFISAFKVDVCCFGYVLRKMVRSGKADALRAIEAKCTKHKPNERSSFSEIVAFLENL